MVLTIVPAVRGESLPSLLRFHGAGLLLGALVTGLVLALTAAVLRSLPSGEVLVVAGVGVLAVVWAPTPLLAMGKGMPWPRSHWQVPEHWRYTLPMPFTLLAFGFLLGVGFLTSPVLPLYWVFVGLSLVSENLIAVVVAWLVYGVTRWAMTARKSRKVVAAGEIPDDVYGPSGLSWARGLTFVALVLVVVHQGLLVQSL